MKIELEIKREKEKGIKKKKEEKKEEQDWNEEIGIEHIKELNRLKN